MAGQLWTVIDGGTTVRALIERVTEAFPDTSRREVRADIATFVDGLERQGLVEVGDPG